MIHLFAGIDVSKDTLDISATLDGVSFHSFHTANSGRGFAALFRWLSKLSGSDWRISLEATSAYHRQLVLWFAAKDIGILVLNPKQARDLAKGLGILRKSDRTDAKVLALCSQMAWKEPTPLPSGKRMELQEISRRIDVMTRQRAGELTRLQKPGACKALLASCRRMAKLLAKEILLLEQQWVKTLEECAGLATGWQGWAAAGWRDNRLGEPTHNGLLNGVTCFLSWQTRGLPSTSPGTHMSLPSPLTAG